jgi:hypothetical protein
VWLPILEFICIDGGKHGYTTWNLKYGTATPTVRWWLCAIRFSPFWVAEGSIIRSEILRWLWSERRSNRKHSVMMEWGNLWRVGPQKWKARRLHRWIRNVWILCDFVKLNNESSFFHLSGIAEAVTIRYFVKQLCHDVSVNPSILVDCLKDTSWIASNSYSTRLFMQNVTTLLFLVRRIMSPSRFFFCYLDQSAPALIPRRMIGIIYRWWCNLSRYD